MGLHHSSEHITQIRINKVVNIILTKRRLLQFNTKTYIVFQLSIHSDIVQHATVLFSGKTVLSSRVTQRCFSI